MPRPGSGYTSKGWRTVRIDIQQFEAPQPRLGLEAVWAFAPRSSKALQPSYASFWKHSNAKESWQWWQWQQTAEENPWCLRNISQNPLTFCFFYRRHTVSQFRAHASLLRLKSPQRIPWSITSEMDPSSAAPCCCCNDALHGGWFPSRVAAALCWRRLQNETGPPPAPQICPIPSIKHLQEGIPKWIEQVLNHDLQDIRGEGLQHANPQVSEV